MSLKSQKPRNCSPAGRLSRKIRFPGPISALCQSLESRKAWQESPLTRRALGMLFWGGHPVETMKMQVNPRSICILRFEEGCPKNKSVTIDKLTKMEKQRLLIADTRIREMRLLPVYLERNGSGVVREEIAFQHLGIRCVFTGSKRNEPESIWLDDDEVNSPGKERYWE